MSVFDLHVHTVGGSSDSSLTPGQLIEEAQRLGLDGVCLTEHSGGWDDQRFQKAFEEAEITVIRALEVDTDMGHVLAFGIHSYVNGIHKSAQLRRTVDRAGGVLISAHPFRNIFNTPPYNENLLFRDPDTQPETPGEAANHPLFELVDDIEVANGSNTTRENLFTLEVAQDLGWTGTGGSDAHSTHGLGRCLTSFHGEVRSEADMIEALKAREYTPAQGFRGGRVLPFNRDSY